jgi:hypothetical protein
VQNLAKMGEISGRPPCHYGLSCPIFTCILKNTSTSHPDQQSTRLCITQSKGLGHGLMDPHAVSTLLFRLKTAFLDDMHALIDKSVQ